tara:strand:+ start:10921 stop:11391 length:471 start_codon:yes stop_codon:yes gene_type:complete
LIKGRDSPWDHLDNGDAALSGRVFVVTTWRTGKGEEDFRHILQRQHHKIRKTIRVNWLKYSDRALAQAIHEHINAFLPGDIVAIVRGGGDTKEKQFAPFNNPDAVKAVRTLREQYKVVVVTGVGHSTDHFAIERVATFNQATPTDAAYLICDLLHG